MLAIRLGPKPVLLRRREAEEQVGAVRDLPRHACPSRGALVAGAVIRGFTLGRQHTKCAGETPGPLSDQGYP